MMRTDEEKAGLVAILTALAQSNPTAFYNLLLDAESPGFDGAILEDGHHKLQSPERDE